jgi:4-hydroxythreonine-4-phosphate dehydrogenase
VKAGARFVAGALDRAVAGPLPVGITMGDPAGVGPEVIIKSLLMPGGGACRVIGSRAVFRRALRRARIRLDLGCVDNSVPHPGRFQMGEVQRRCGRAALRALVQGVRLLRRGAISALVTAPVSKQALRLAGFRWPGQTEFLADRLGAKRHAMLAWTPKFKVAFVTIHLPLARVPRRITPDRVLEKIRLLDDFLRREGAKGTRYLNPRDLDPSIPPRICVMALNPHAFEFSLGEDEKIAQAVAEARRQGIDVAGPVPADAAVVSRSPKEPVGRFDGYVAMYHDQAMIPAKLLGRDQGVNVTLGLPFVRTSPLHGTAFDIAGRGIANPGSMLAAIRLARRLAR